MSYDELRAANESSGARAYSGFCYQAELAVAFCVDCATGGKIISVFPELVEDIALETTSGWRFIQVKTKNPDIGPWTLTEVTAEHGALRSLVRAYRNLPEVPYTLELYLEGPIRNGDLLRALQDPPDGDVEDCHRKCIERLELKPEEAPGFFDRLRVRGNNPSRDSIHERNLRYLRAGAGNHDYDALDTALRALATLVNDAMAEDGLRTDYPVGLISPPDDPASEVILRKRLTRDRLTQVLGSLAQREFPLIRQFSDAGSTSTALEEKLIAGGATDGIVRSAKLLRANASYNKEELLARGGFEDELKSVEEMLKLRAATAVALFETERKPAVHIWARLIDTLSPQATDIDPYRLFGNPDLLLGEICDLADACLVDWGRAQ